jgi:hypothetical protein
MSAFIVSDTTIHHAAYVLAERNTACEDLDRIGQEMLKLNIRAVNYRYPKQQHDVTQAEHYRYSPRGMNRFQQLKSLQCWIYQCAESDELMAHPLWQQARNVERQLMFEIISELPEYNAAKWD